MKSFREFAGMVDISEGYKKVNINLGGPFNISKLGYDANGNWSYMVSKGAGKPKKIQHQGDWPSKITKDDNTASVKNQAETAEEIIKYYKEFITEEIQLEEKSRVNSQAICNELENLSDGQLAKVFAFVLQLQD